MESKTGQCKMVTTVYFYLLHALRLGISFRGILKFTVRRHYYNVEHGYHFGWQVKTITDLMFYEKLWCGTDSNLGMDWNRFIFIDHVFFCYKMFIYDCVLYDAGGGMSFHVED